jgi:Ca2+-binding RTX toxin-like protein
VVRRRRTKYSYRFITGGADTQSGGAGNDRMYGDVITVDSGATLLGGDDILMGDDGDDALYGDAQTLSTSSVGGNDILRKGWRYNVW